MSASQTAHHWTRIVLFALICFALSLLVIAVDLFALFRRIGAGLGPIYGTEVAASGIPAVLLHAWRRDAPIAANLLASLSFLAMPALSLFVFFLYIVPLLYAGWPKDVSPL